MADYISQITLPNNKTYDLKDAAALPKSGGILTGGLEVKGHIAGDGSTTTGHGLWGGGAYHNAYNNIILHGDASTGSSGIAFISDKVAADGTITNRNAPSDRAFIQYHACGVTTATAEGTNPTLASGSEEAGRLVIGIGNDAGDKIILQAPGATDIVHQMGASSYPIPHTTNTNGSVGGTTTPVYVDAGVIKAGTALGGAAYKAENYYATSSHNHNASDINAGILNTARLPDDVVKKRTGLSASTTETDLFSLIPGMYDHTSSGVDNALPTGYGTILNIAGSYYYGALIAAETNNSLYYRAYYYENDEHEQWRGNWQMVAHADYGTAKGNATKPIYISNAGVITEGDAIGASAYHDDSYFALASHGNHVPATQTANNITFLRNDNTWYKLTAADVSTLINLLSTGDSPLTANDYVITQYVGGGTTTTTYHRRPASKVVNATLVKAALGTVSTTAKKFLKDTGAWAQVAWDDLSGKPSTYTPTIGNTATTAMAGNTTITNVTHTLGTTTKYYVTGSTTATTNTSGDTFDTGVYVTTTPGQLSATSYNINYDGNEKVTLRWNNTDSSLDFIFV